MAFRTRFVGSMHYHLTVDHKRCNVPDSDEPATWRTLPAARSALKATKAQRSVSNQPPARLSVCVCHCNTTVGLGVADF